MNKRSAVLILIFLLSGGLVFSGQYINHDMKVKIDPDNHLIKATDQVTFPEVIKRGKIHFLLHGNLKIVSYSSGVSINEEKGEIKSRFFGINTSEFKISDKIPIKHYSIKFLKPLDSFNVNYEGEIYHPLKMSGAEYSRGFSQTPGIISRDGVYLSGSSFWVPWFNEKLVTFKVGVELPEKWESVSQGKQIEKGWVSKEPMDEIYLIAGKFYNYKTKVNNVNILAFLRSPDKNLASKYLDTTGQYLKMYEKLIGKYPYTKFALIENFWETGYGMPSFTLLGPKIIRFPFILHSSYPHELLHNWWGNSVFVDYEKGNWCEGLTVFMADHLIKEQRGQGSDYRRDTLKGYKDYVNDENEFPVSEFKARYNASSSAIGYGKVMMIFDMLRLRFGDKVFLNSIRDFYKNNIYRKATFKDIENSFEKITGKDLKHFFTQWVYRKGAPTLKLSEAKVVKGKKQYEVKLRVSQVKVKKPYSLYIPVYFYLKNDTLVKVRYLKLKELSGSFSFKFKSEPLKIEIDPQFDVFRILSDEEIPSTFSNILGSKRVTIVLPSKDSEIPVENYRKLAKIWAKDRGKGIKVVSDSEIEKLPDDQPVWIFGWENRFRSSVEKQLKKHGSGFTRDILTLGDKNLNHRENTLVFTVKSGNNKNVSTAFLSVEKKEAVPGLARKLPHYGKYSYLSFSGNEPAVNFKGQWSIEDSPLVKVFEKSDFKDFKKPERKALGYLDPLFSKESMIKNLNFLASMKLKGRGLGSEELNIAAEFIKGQFRKYGLKPGMNNGDYFQRWEVKLPIFKEKKEIKNVIGVIPGNNPEYKDQAVVISAHYDHLGLGWPDVRKGNEGKIHPGADDNASGVTVMLELARILGKNFKPERSLIFIAFTGEENGLMGSSYFVKNIRPGSVSNIIADINLDTVGRLHGKKPMIIGSSSAKQWKFIFMGIGFTTGIECDLIQQDLDASDQVSFIRRGIPAVQIFSGPHTDYHKPSDTVDKIDFDGMLKIADITKEAIVYLSERKLPLNFTGKKGMEKKTSAKIPVKKSDGGRPSIGIMPDFTFNGEGVKVGMVINRSGIRGNLMKGDVIIYFNGVKVKDLKSYTRELYKYKPGESVDLKIIRANRQINIKIKLRKR